MTDPFFIKRKPVYHRVTDTGAWHLAVVAVSRDAPMVLRLTCEFAAPTTAENKHSNTVAINGVNDRWSPVLEESELPGTTADFDAPRSLQSWLVLMKRYGGSPVAVGKDAALTTDFFEVLDTEGARTGVSLSKWCADALHLTFVRAANSMTPFCFF